MSKVGIDIGVPSNRHAGPASSARPESTRGAACPAASASAAEVEIRQALARRAEGVDWARVRILVDGSCVVLSGSVRTRRERTCAVVAAWDASGVSHVIDDLATME